MIVCIDRSPGFYFFCLLLSCLCLKEVYHRQYRLTCFFLILTNTLIEVFRPHMSELFSKESVSILGHVVSFASAQFCHGSVKAVIDDMCSDVAAIIKLYL